MTQKTIEFKQFEADYNDNINLTKNNINNLSLNKEDNTVIRIDGGQKGSC